MLRRLLSRLWTRRGALRLAIAFLLFGLGAPQVWAWYHLRSAKRALVRYHPEEARPALAECERVWGWRASVRLLGCRAAWQGGDTDGAVAELQVAQRLAGGATDDTAFEWALVRAASGNVREVEQYLQKRAEEAPATAGPLVWEALAVGYLRVYRTLDAMACLEYWLRREPENVRALELRGATFVAGKGVTRGVEDYRRVLERDPARAATRWRLIDGLLALGGYEEAATHLEVVAQQVPDDPAVAARLARCYNILGRADDARRMIDAALAGHPDDVACLRTRGQLALTARPSDPAAAEVDLRRAAALAPNDYQTQNLLFQALQQQGKIEEAKERLKLAEGVRERGERISELSSRKLAEFPLDPALHYEMGHLLLAGGHPDTAVEWFQNALRLDPAHRPSHAALATFYEGRGDKAKAEFHRARADGREKKEPERRE
ncbi:MAG TPA: tetratricopeptide repeat protein [Gemmata sp.]